MNSLKKNIIFNYIGQFYVMFIGIFMLPFYLKYLGSESYGLVGFFTVITSIMMLLDMGLSSTLAREAARLKNKNSDIYQLRVILKSIEVVIFIITTILFFTIYFSSSWITTNWLQSTNMDIQIVQNCIKLMGFMLAIRWFVGLHQGVVIGLEQQVWLNLYKMIINTLKFIGGLILIIYISNDIFYFFIYQTFISIIEFIILRKKVYTELSIAQLIKPSLQELKRIAPFALSIAYTSVLWAFYSQFDKLLLSHYISLKEYGYLALVVAIQGAIMQFSGPLSRAIQPRMVSLLSNNKEEEMLLLYSKSTRLISTIMSSVVGIVVAFSYELLYSWSGDIEASLWASPILFWFAIGNGILAISAFRYYLQYAHGNMKYQNRFNTFSPFISVSLIFYAVSNYGAYGASITWFSIHLTTFLLWTPYIHSKFAPGIHLKWILKDILPPVLLTTIYLFFIKQINIDFSIFSRIETFFILLGLGLILLIFNSLIYKDMRKIIFNSLQKFLNFTSIKKAQII